MSTLTLPYPHRPVNRKQTLIDWGAWGLSHERRDLVAAVTLAIAEEGRRHG